MLILRQQSVTGQQTQILHFELNEHASHSRISYMCQMRNKCVHASLKKYEISVFK